MNYTHTLYPSDFEIYRSDGEIDSLSKDSYESKAKSIVHRYT